MNDLNEVEFEIQCDDNLVDEVEEVIEQEKIIQDDELLRLRGELESLRAELNAKNEYIRRLLSF